MENKKKVIGITGLSGSGKSTFVNCLVEEMENHLVIDIDKLVPKALDNESLIEKTIQLFGDGILNESGRIDRKRLGELFFRDEEKRMIQKQNTWGYIEKEIDGLLLRDCKYFIFDWFYLPETKYFEYCNYKVLIIAEDKIRKDKIIKRDNISLDYLELREKDQLQFHEEDYDRVIFNDYETNLKEKARSLIYQIN